MHYASVEITATFTDFAALSWWVSDVAERDGVQVDGVTWRLTPATAKATEADVAAQAVQGRGRARHRVRRAPSASRRSTPLEIADLGLLTDASGAGRRPRPR